MSNINIKLAEKSDVDFIKILHKESKNEIGSFNLFYSWDDYLAKKTPYNFYIFYDGDEKVGFMRFGLSKQLKCYVVKEIAIASKFKGMGYGKKFIQKMPRPIYLTCNEDNVVGNAFYKAAGFTGIGKKMLKNKKWVNVWIIQ
jgi:ribosomal protein S18 acetylase RimI-like enzyme